MEVKIVKSSKDSYWYADQIGMIFEVTGVQEDVYEVKKSVSVVPYSHVIAPVLKEDCEERYIKSVVEPNRTSNWGTKPDRRINLIERSGFNTSREIEIYEKLNKEAAIKTTSDNK